MQTAVNEFLSLGCIDKSGIANSLVAKMAAAQNAISHGQFQAAVNIITAFITELQAQAGKHIATTCSAGGHTYHPVQILLSDAQYLVSTLPAQPTADPVMGYVINSALAGIPGIAVNLLNSTKVVVGTAVTDVTGFYYFAATSTLTTGKSYSARVTIPNGYRSSSPSSQSFTWSASTVTLSNFALK
jgi:hypothetical protein